MRKLLAAIMVAVMALAPLTARAEDTAPEVIMHEDWEHTDNTRPEQLFSETFRATVAFKPTNVTAKANRNSITVTADCNTAVPRMTCSGGVRQGVFAISNTKRLYW